MPSTLPSAMTTPRYVDLEITGRCNLRCSYCYHFSSPGDVGHELTTSEWLDFFEELGRNQVIHVMLGGGEPFCRKDLPILLQGIAANRMRFSIVTNGTLLDETTAAMVKATDRCDMVYVSLDSYRAEEHDVFRGSGSFADAARGLEILRAGSVPFSIRMTLHKQNYRALRNTADFALQRAGADYFSANEVSYFGLCRANVKDLILSPAERSEAMTELFLLYESYGDRVKAFAGLLSEAVNWVRMERNRQGHAEPEEGFGCLAGCTGIWDTLAIRADGAMTPCVQLNHIVLGWVNNDEVAQVWRNHQELSRLRAGRQTSLGTFATCRDCEYRRWCKGGCPGLAQSLLGRDNVPCSETCLRAHYMGGGTLPQPAALPSD